MIYRMLGNSFNSEIYFKLWFFFLVSWFKTFSHRFPDAC